MHTRVSYAQVLPLCFNVKKRIVKACEDRGVPGLPFVSCRVTQVGQSWTDIYAHARERYGNILRAHAHTRHMIPAPVFISTSPSSTTAWSVHEGSVRRLLGLRFCLCRHLG